MDSAGEPRVSVIIPAYRAEETLDRCLASLTEQDYERPFELIIINSYNDGCEEIARKRFPDVKFVQLSERAVAAKARNKGLENATGKWIAFLDSDCVADKNWLSNLTATLEAGSVAVAGSISPPSEAGSITRAEFLLEVLLFRPDGPEQEIGFASAANSGYVREVLESCGGFPDIRLGEDLLLGKALRDKGHAIRFMPGLRVVHLPLTSMKPFLRKQYDHGRYSARARRRGKLAGAFLVKSPLFIPLLPFVRMWRVASGCARRGASAMVDLLSTSPVVLVGILAWSAGFAAGVLEREPQKH